MRCAPPCTRSASRRTCGKLCANVSPCRMMPLAHVRDRRIFFWRCRLRRPAVRACTNPELTAVRACLVLAGYGVQLRGGCCSAGACRSGGRVSLSLRPFFGRSCNLALGRWGRWRTAAAIARDSRMLRQCFLAHFARTLDGAFETVRLVVRFGRRQERGRSETVQR